MFIFGASEFVGVCGSEWEYRGDNTNRPFSIFFRSAREKWFEGHESSERFLPPKKQLGQSAIPGCLSGQDYNAWWFCKTPSLFERWFRTVSLSTSTGQWRWWFKNIQSVNVYRKQIWNPMGFREFRGFVHSHTLPHHSHTLPHDPRRPKLISENKKYFPIRIRAVREADTNRGKKITPECRAGAPPIDFTF